MGKPSRSDVWLPASECIAGVEVYTGKLNISVPVGEENNCDSVSSGERTWMMAKTYVCDTRQGLHVGGCGAMTFIFCRMWACAAWLVEVVWKHLP